MSLLSVYFNFRRALTFLQTDLHMISTWDVHLQLELNVTPRCVCFSVFTKVVLPNVSVMLSVTVELMYKTSVFDRLNVTNQRLDQSSKISKSEFMLYSISLLSQDDADRDVSSAKRRAKLAKLSAMSFIYNRNKKGPRTDPWGTPALVLVYRNSEVKEFTVTHCCLSDK